MPRPRSRLLALGSSGFGAITRFVQEMRRFKRDPRELSKIRDFAGELVDDVKPNDEIGEIRALFEYVRDGIRYTKDVNGVDTLQTPTVTLEKLRGDCDDKALLLAALLESIGYPTRFSVAATLPGSDYNHVFVEAQVPRTGRWIPLEASVPSYPFARQLRTFRPLRRFA